MQQPSVLILTHYFPPEMGAAQVRLSELGSRLQALGWRVQVLTALPNYPTGKIFDGYSSKLSVREQVCGLDTVRTWVIPSKSRKILPRMLCYLSFAFSALLFGRTLCEKPDLVWVESPPLFLGMTARLLARRWKIPYVCNVSDLWPDTFVEIGVLNRTSLAFRLMKRLELACYAGAAGVTGQTGEIISAVQESMPTVNTELITNGVDPERFGKQLRDLSWIKKAGWGGKCVFVYAGYHGVAQGLNQILAVAARLQHRRDILFALIGDGPCKDHLQATVTRDGLQNVKFYPPQKRDRMPSVLASADAALITLQSPIYGAVPSKIYEAMACERPILLVAELEAAERVRRAGAGLTVNCGDIDSLLEGVLRIADEPDLRNKLGTAGRQAAQQVYARDVVANRLSNFLNRVIRGELRPVRVEWKTKPAAVALDA